MGNKRRAQDGTQPLGQNCRIPAQGVVKETQFAFVSCHLHDPSIIHHTSDHIRRTSLDYLR